MPAQTKAPLSRRIQRRVFRVVNVPMRFMLGLPFPTPPGNRLMLVFLTGRKTGKKYRQPVSYVRDGAALLSPGGGNWKLNLSPDKPVRMRLRGRDVTARPDIVADPAEVERLLDVMAAANPMAARFVGIPRGPEGKLDPERLSAALRYGFRVIRWHLDDAGNS
jgi:F420H(2)-dependent quinone reductase